MWTKFINLDQVCPQLRTSAWLSSRTMIQQCCRLKRSFWITFSSANCSPLGTQLQSGPLPAICLLLRLVLLLFCMPLHCNLAFLSDSSAGIPPWDCPFRCSTHSRARGWSSDLPDPKYVYEIQINSSNRINCNWWQVARWRQYVAR